MSSTPLAGAPSVRNVARPDPSAVRDWVELTCAAQGIAGAVTDESTIARVVALLGSPDMLGRRTPTRSVGARGAR